MYILRVYIIRVRAHNKHANQKNKNYEKYKTNQTKGILRRGRIQMTQKEHVHILAEEDQITAARTDQQQHC